MRSPHAAAFDSISFFHQIIDRSETSRALGVEHRFAEFALSFKRALIGAGFAALATTGLHKALAAPGRGFILTLHRVRPLRSALF